MSISYWDGWTSSTNASSVTSSTSTTASGSGFDEYYYWTGSAGGSVFYTAPRYIVRTRLVLVPEPEGWSEDDSLAFVRLVNIETRTGWKVDMLIKGDILVTDPDIETRSMQSFLPLLKSRASQPDIDAINAFFDEHPIEARDEP